MAETNELASKGFHVDINLTELCENYLINNISKIRMPKKDKRITTYLGYK